MSDFTPLGNCGKKANICFPDLEDDLCLGCPINGWEEMRADQEELSDEEILEKETT